MRKFATLGALLHLAVRISILKQCLHLVSDACKGAFLGKLGVFVGYLTYDNVAGSFRDNGMGDKVVGTWSLEAALLYLGLPEAIFERLPVLLIKRIVVFIRFASTVEDVVPDQIEGRQRFSIAVERSEDRLRVVFLAELHHNNLKPAKEPRKNGIERRFG